MAESRLARNQGEVMRNRALIWAALATLPATAALAGPNTQFDNFTPLASSAPAGSLPEAAPFSLSSPHFSQSTLNANDAGAQNGGAKLGDNWDMITLNESGPSAGRYLFAPYETGSAGVRRLDLSTGQALSLVAPGTQGFVSGDASRWTPFGTYLTAEESWGAGSTKGRLFEITNPLADPADANFVARTVLPRVSHEGLAFDKDNNLYFIDENGGGSIYRYTSKTPTDGATFFDAGQTFALKVGDGSTAEAQGAATWAPITDENGAALFAGSVVNIGGVDQVDGRVAADLAGATSFARPEDLEIQNLGGGEQRLFFAATTNHKTFAIDLVDADNATVQLFASRDTVDAFTGLAVGSPFANPDNLAIDADGNIYIIEDQGAGFADIWFAFDEDRDGVAESLGRWASLTTLGAEPTGLYFDPFRPNVAYINVQHASSDVDRTIQFTVPEPGLAGLLGLAVVAMVSRRGRKAA